MQSLFGIVVNQIEVTFIVPGMASCWKSLGVEIAVGCLEPELPAYSR